MTLKELLTQVGFDELLPYLEKHEPEHLDNLYDFREAYDILRNMKPANNFEGKIFVEWHGGEWEDEEKWIGVSPMHDCTWEEDLAKEIVVADDILYTSLMKSLPCIACGKSLIGDSHLTKEKKHGKENLGQRF